MALWILYILQLQNLPLELLIVNLSLNERESRNSESVPDNNTEMQGNREPTIDQREGRDRELVPDSNSETEGKCQLLEYTKVSRVLLLLLLHKRKYFSPFYL